MQGRIGYPQTAREKKDSCITRVSVFIGVSTVSIGYRMLLPLCLYGGGDAEALILPSVHLPVLLRQQMLPKENGLPHQPSGWFAMTSVVVTFGGVEGDEILLI